MTDEADIAAEQQQRLNEAALASRQRSTAGGRTTCRDCGETISGRRRDRLPGVERCVDCQNDYERFSAPL